MPAQSSAPPSSTAASGPGPAGPAGQSAYSFTSAAVSAYDGVSPLTLTLQNVSWIPLGSPLFVASVGTFTVTAINTVSLQVTLAPAKLIGTAPYNIPVNALVSASGLPGPTGLTGATGAPGVNGNTIWNGTTAPSNSLGQNGDFYLNTLTNVLFGPKAGGIWPSSGTSIIGPQGIPGAVGGSGTNGNTIWNGTTQPPSSSLGVNGDFYLNTANETLWGPKAGGVWPGSGVSLVGPQGTSGNTIWNGTTTPPAGLGQNGDFYVNTTTNILYGPKAAGVWPGTGISMVGSQGASGNTIWNGSTQPPSPSLGANGDFYLNTVNNTLWGPKAGGAWPSSGASLVGPAGTPGSTGATGPAGPTAVSTDPGNVARLGSDHLLFVPSIGSTSDFGDLTPPPSPTVYDDEFTAGTLSSIWTVTGTQAGVTFGLQAPTYLTAAINYGAAGSIATKATQNLTAPVLSASFMFQFKVRWALGAYQVAAASSAAYMEFAVGLSKTTATQKGFWLYGIMQYITGASGTLPQAFPLQLVISRGVNAGTVLNSLFQSMSGLDLRVQMGVNSSGNLVCNISMDGYNWTQVYSETYSTGPTFTGLVPNLLTLDLDNSGTPNTNNSAYAAFDYVRCLHL